MQTKKVIQEGYDFVFDPSACAECGGKCCTGESGNIWVTQNELQNIAKLLGRDLKSVEREYVIRKGIRYSLKEIKLARDNYRCVFFDMQAKGCSVYDARPAQCKSFPFWPSLKNDRAYLEAECIGVQFL